jgi:L,D-transpeptidase YcbB
MNKSFTKLLLLTLIFSFSHLFSNCKKNSDLKNSTNLSSTSTVAKIYELESFDSTSIASLYKKYEKLSKYKTQVLATYKRHNFQYLWFDKHGKKETSEVLYNRINNISKDGILKSIPYKEILDAKMTSDKGEPDLETELLLTSYYYFYTDEVIGGVAKDKLKDIGWFLPKKNTSYVDLLDSLLVNPKLAEKQEQVINQYYLLKEVLQKYRSIAEKGGWPKITLDPSIKSLKEGDSLEIIGQIRNRLYLTGDLKDNSKSIIYDETLKKGILNYQKRNGFDENPTILPKHIAELNVTIEERIKQIEVNMERCRWIPVEFSKAKEYIVVNIPAYKLEYYKNGAKKFESAVVVGSKVHKTVIFSGELKNIVFSPYWNVPSSIINKEVKPGMANNKNYLEQHNMEWNNGSVRQKPGPRNSLGVVKFLFPNSNNIYLHDTPSKSLFNEEQRAFSHGCIRVGKPKELAYVLLEDDPNWSKQKMDAAMSKTTETWYSVKRPVHVYIGYFTAWVDKDGSVNFYNDVYNRDQILYNLIAEK